MGTSEDGSNETGHTFVVSAAVPSGGDVEEQDIEEVLIGTGSLNDRLMKAYLDEVLLILIMSHDGACGQDLIQDLYRLGSGLSPGTIYPHLHELAEDGLLEMHEQRRTKQFEVTDRETVRDLVQDAFEDLAVLSSVFNLCDSGDSPEADGSQS